jgi:four helix bundle protein
MAHNLKKLTIWNEAIELAKDIYGETSSFPKEERFGLTSQMNRFSVSVASNIAEGAGRNNPKEFYQFLGMANGSLNELLTQMFISNKIGFVKDEKLIYFESKIEKIQRSISNLKKTLIQKSSIKTSDI